VALGGDALIVSVLKAIEHVTRPTNGILFDTGFSYPSGHSAGCIVFGGVLAYFAWRHWQKHAFESFNRAGIGAVVGVVGFDRIYLNVHWMSDVFWRLAVWGVLVDVCYFAVSAGADDWEG
jgi:undecaprenyl-diphosphatase